MSIKIEHLVAPSMEQWNAVICGMRNPMNSWDKSDSKTCNGASELCNRCRLAPSDRHGPFYCGSINKGRRLIVGPNDLDLMKRLCKAGSEHRKFMRMLPIMIDITAPLYWWKEFDTYKIGTAANSCSTMHKIHAKEFTLEDFSCEHLMPVSRNNLMATIGVLNQYRYLYEHYDDMKSGKVIMSKEAEEILKTLDKKDIWWQMIQLLPSSYNQTRTVYMNYEVLLNICRQRENHKLDEWRIFVKWIKNDVPYFKEITEEE